MSDPGRLWRWLVDQRWPLPPVTPLTTVAERYLTSPAAFTAMELTCIVVAGGSSLRRHDGRIDRGVVTRLVAPLWSPPDMRRRLVTPLVGLSAPAWVETGSEMVYEVSFRDGPVRVADLALALRDEHSRSTVLGGPVVRARALDLDDGTVGLVFRAHHIAGDGLWAERSIRRVFAESALEDPPRCTAESRPRCALPRAAVPLAVLLSWARRHPSAGGAWADWRRVSLVGRTRRLVGRSLRPLRRSQDLDVSGRAVRVLVWSFREVRARARARSCGVLALLALAAADAQAAAERITGAVDVLAAVPAVGLDGAAPAGGPMLMQALTVPPVGSTTERAATVHAQLASPSGRETARSGSAGPRAVPPYVTLLPGFPRRMERLGARALRVFFLPAVDPQQPFGVLGAATGDEFCVSVVADTEERGAHVVDALVDVFGPPRWRG